MGNSIGKLFTITNTGNEKHIDACLAIGKELPRYFTEQAMVTMSQDLVADLLYVAVNLKEVAGFVAIKRKNNHVAEISWMAVKLEHQRQGIGSALMDYVANELGSQGIRLLEVKTVSEDVDYPPYEKTRRFYERMGFMHLETIDPYPGWEMGTPCAIYVKIL